jgi:hypothetical protein
MLLAEFYLDNGAFASSSTSSAAFYEIQVTEQTIMAIPFQPVIDSDAPLVRDLDVAIGDSWHVFGK